MRSGTITRRSIARPPASAVNWGAARSARSTSSRAEPGGTVSTNLVLPLTCTGRSTTVGGATRAASASREVLVSERALVAQPVPQLLGDMRRQRRDHQHQRLGEAAGQLAARAASLAAAAGQLRQPGDRGVELAARRSPRRPPRSSWCSSRAGLASRLPLADRRLAGLLVDAWRATAAAGTGARRRCRRCARAGRRRAGPCAIS